MGQMIVAMLVEVCFKEEEQLRLWSNCKVLLIRRQKDGSVLGWKRNGLNEVVES